MQKEYGLSVSAEDFLEGVNQVVKDFYYKEAVMKPGAYALVKRLKENGVKLIIATATDKEMAKAALIRNGIWQDYTGMITCEEAGAGKIGFPMLKSKTFSAPISAARFLLYSKISRMTDFLVPRVTIFSESI